MMAGLSHKNIVQLVGFVEDFERGIAWIVMSWEPNGNVSEFLAGGKWEIPERISLVGHALITEAYRRRAHGLYMYSRSRIPSKASNIFTLTAHRYVMET